MQPRQGEVRVHGGLNTWWQTHTECFTQERSADKHSWHRETESRPKRPRQAGPGVLQGVQDLIAELVAKGYRIVYTEGSSKRLSHKDMCRAGGFGVFAAEDEQGPEVHFCGYVPTRHRQTNNGAELWAALEALQGFWVPTSGQPHYPQSILGGLFNHQLTPPRSPPPSPFLPPNPIQKMAISSTEFCNLEVHPQQQLRQYLLSSQDE